MRRDEVIKILKSIPHNAEVAIIEREGMQLPIKHIDYRPNHGVNELISIVPMGSYLPKYEKWVRFEDI